MTGCLCPLWGTRPSFPQCAVVGVVKVDRRKKRFFFSTQAGIELLGLCVDAAVCIRNRFLLVSVQLSQLAASVHGSSAVHSLSLPEFLSSTRLFVPVIFLSLVCLRPKWLFFFLLFSFGLKCKGDGQIRHSWVNFWSIARSLSLFGSYFLHLVFYYSLPV